MSDFNALVSAFMELNRKVEHLPGEHDQQDHAGGSGGSSKSIKPEELKFQNDSTGAYAGQVNLKVTAKDSDGHRVGYLDYSYYDGKLHINMIHVEPEHRRKGIGLKLYKTMVAENPDTAIKWGMMTPEGFALRQAIIDEKLGKRPKEN